MEKRGGTSLKVKLGFAFIEYRLSPIKNLNNILRFFYDLCILSIFRLKNY